ncbi:MAG: aspartyl protease family protein [Sphingomonadaceae bacterium]
MTLITASLMLAAPLAAQTPPLIETNPITSVTTRQDSAMRMTVPVKIDGRGPYDFVIDTGADRTVVSREIATALQLGPGDPVTMHSMTGVSGIGTVRVDRLDLAGHVTRDIHAPALEEANLGAHGLLGLDTLKGRRIVMDFAKRRLSVLAAGEKERDDPDTIVVTARSRYGQLVLVDADVDGTPITVIIDSGAQSTIGNSALRRLLAKRNRKLEFFKTVLIDVTGGQLPAEYAAVGRMRIAGLIMANPVIAFADAHPFARYGLANKPAMLLGMDSLRGFKRVSVDFAQRKVRFLLADVPS